MPERPQLPPPDTMIREIPTPDPTVGFYTELVSRTSPRFQEMSPIRRGTPYAACKGADQRVIDLFPAGLFFLKEIVPIGSDTVAGMAQSNWVKWLWGSVLSAESATNAEVTFLGDAVANPAYARAYTIRRSAFEAAPTIALGTALTALIGVKVTVAGAGYQIGDTVNIAGGLGAEAKLVVNATGGIVNVIVTKEGAGYDSAALPAVTVTSATGAGATLVAIVQPKTAILTSQKKVELPDSDPRSHEFVQALRVYETLPGPLLPYTRFDENLGPVQGSRQAVVWANQAAAVTATGKTTHEAREGSSYVAWKIVEAWSDGTGGADNPAYPIGKTDFYDNERGAVHQTSQITTDTTTAGSLVVAAGVVTLIRYEPLAENPLLRKKIIETWAVPGPTLRTQERYDKDLGKITGTRQLVENTGQAQTATATVLTRYEESKYGAVLIWKIIESWSLPGPIQTFTEFEKDGVKKVVTRQLMATGSVVTSETLGAGTLTRQFRERYNEFLAFQIIETITVDDADLLDLPTFTTSIENLIPQIFRGTIPTHVESHIVEGTAAETALVLGEFEHSERQLTPLYMEVRSTVLDDIGSLPITITGQKETNDKKQVVTVAMKLCLDSTTPTLPTALIDVDFKKLGNGLAVEITKTIPSVFDATVFAKQRDDNVPGRFKKATPEITEKHVAPGTAAAPSFSDGDTAKSEQQRDVFTKETSVTNRAVGGYPTLEGQNYDETLDVVIPYSETVDPAGTNIGSARTEVTPLGTDVYGDDVEQAKEIDAVAFAAVLDDYLLSFPGTTNLQLPDVLDHIDSFIETQSGAGDSHETAGSAAWSGQGSFTLSPRSDAQSSVVAMPDVSPVIFQSWGRNVPTTHYLFFLPNPVTANDVLVALTLLAIVGATVTVTIASPGVVSWTAHGMSNDDPFIFATTGVLPTGFSPGIIYYVKNKTANTFQLALTAGGAAINTSGSQSGVHTGRAAIKSWPKFKPETVTVFCVGGRASVQAKASAFFHDGGSDSGSEVATSSGNGASIELAITIKAIRIPPTIHSITGVAGFGSDTYSIDATADADAYVIDDTRTAEAFLNAYVTPLSFAATSGATAIPSSGNYLIDTNAAPYRMGYVRIQCEIVNAANI